MTNPGNNQRNRRASRSKALAPRGLAQTWNLRQVRAGSLQRQRPISEDALKGSAYERNASPTGGLDGLLPQIPRGICAPAEPDGAAGMSATA